MFGSELKALEQSARILVTDEFLSGLEKPDFSNHERPLRIERRISLETLDGLISHVLTAAEYQGVQEDSDAWLAPRLHASLRLTPSEAADRRIWTWLAVVRYDEYVRWRFPGTDGVTTAKRFFGQDRDNALSRLWWGAELTRNGSDYSPSQAAFQRQDIPNTWFALDAFHNRAAALAALRMLPGMGARPINRLSKALNHYLTTVMLDSVAPVRAPDAAALEEWISDMPLLDDLVQDDLPSGPQEDPVEEALVEAVERLLRQVASEVGIPLSD